MSNEIRLACLASGGGTTVQQIIASCNAGALKGVKPVLVIASRNIAGVRVRAYDEGISPENILTIRPKDFITAELFGERIIEECRKRDVNLIGQYGWMVKTPNNVIDAFPGMMINQHPGPIDPSEGIDRGFGGDGMYGMRVHAARLYFVRKTDRNYFTEATAQRVAVEYDAGAILHKIRVPIYKGDDPTALQERVLPIEWQVQIETLQMFANGIVNEVIQDELLVFDDEIPILNAAQDAAFTLFPKG